MLYIHGIDDPDYIQFALSHPDVKFSSYLDESMLEPNSLLILDDLQMQTESTLNKTVNRLVTLLSHHQKISIIIVYHSLFAKNSYLSRLSTDYCVIMKFLTGGTSLGMYAQQCCSDVGFFKEAYKLSTAKPFSHFFIDLSQHQNNLFRFRSSLFPADDVLIFTPLNS